MIINGERVTPVVHEVNGERIEEFAVPGAWREVTEIVLADAKAKANDGGSISVGTIGPAQPLLSEPRNITITLGDHTDWDEEHAVISGRDGVGRFVGPFWDRFRSKQRAHRRLGRRGPR